MSTAVPKNSLKLLTEREREVMRLIVEGKPNKLICRDLQLSEGTVKVHVSAILKALHVHSRTQAVAELARRGIAVRIFPNDPALAGALRVTLPGDPAAFARVRRAFSEILE